MESAAARWPRPPGRASTPGRGPARSDSRVWSRCGVAGRGSESPVGATRPRVGDPAPSTPLQSPSILMRDRLHPTFDLKLIAAGAIAGVLCRRVCACSPGQGQTAKTRTTSAGRRAPEMLRKRRKGQRHRGQVARAPPPSFKREEALGYRRQISRACSLPLGGTASPGSPPAQGEELRLSRLSDKFNMYSLKARWPGDGHAGLEWGPPGISRAGGVAFHA